MDVQPWITYEPSPSGTGKILTKYEQTSFAQGFTQPLRPLFITIIGQKMKASYLRQMLAVLGRIPTHHQVCLWNSPRLHNGNTPVAVIDCEIQKDPRLFPWPSKTIGTPIPRKDGCWQIAPTDQRNFSALLCTRVFGPLSSVLCYFVADMGGLKATAQRLAEQVTQCSAPASDLLELPRVLLVLETTSDTFDEIHVENRFLTLLSDAIRLLTPVGTVQANFAHYFSAVKVLGLRSGIALHKRAKALKRRLLTMSMSDTYQRQRFSVLHIEALSKRMLEAVVTQPSEPFSLAQASRPNGFSTELFEECLTDCLNQMPSQAWLWQFLAPLVASALFLSCYPPNAHDFPPAFLFDELFYKLCQRAICSYTHSLVVQDKFLNALRAEMELLFVTMKTMQLPAFEIHRQTLEGLHPHLAKFKSHRSCFCCFMRRPEKVLVCGHALCDICIKIFGKRSIVEKNTFELPACILCGVKYSNAVFHLVPPTAGIRVLSVDGGGIRGVIPLTFLTHLETLLSPLCLPIQDYFDFVCGTSAGGLVVIGMFLLQWSTIESISRFEEIAYKTFKNKRTSTVLARAFHFLVAYIEDGQYSLSSIKEAFGVALNSEVKMFNPLRNDTKVAVTTTGACDSAPRLFTNYNGSRRPQNLGYDVLRADAAQDDVTVPDAACSTSAAPWFFKPHVIQTLGTFQDGGLHHNNPCFITQWETQFMWPEKDLPDFFLSLGTGTTLSVLSQRKARFFMRLLRSFMRNIDGEDAWKRFYNSLPARSRDRYYRLNVNLPGEEPQLDDVAKIADLKRQTTDSIARDVSITSVIDLMLASIFYFELDDLPVPSRDGLNCSGYIYCRLNLSVNGRKYLYQQLRDTSSWFLIQGRPTRCVETVPESLPPYRRHVKFTVENLEELLSISLRGITSTARIISGFPVTVQRLVDSQQLQSPFGTVTHAKAEKLLPIVPAKRRQEAGEKAYPVEVCSSRRRLDR